MIHNFLTNRIVLQPTRINWHSNILQGDLTITLRKSLVSQYQHIFHVILFVFGFLGTIWRVPILCFSPNIILFLDNKSSYKMVRISSHPLGSFSSPSPSNISHRKITQTRHIKKFMKKLSRCLPVLPKVRNGFSRIRNLANLAVPGLTGRRLLLSTGYRRRGKYANIDFNPYWTWLPHVQSGIFTIFNFRRRKLFFKQIFCCGKCG